MMQNKATSLYIHIPFCKNICPYCNFLKFYKNKNFEDKYIDNLILDLKKLKENSYLFDTVYIGGGTPTCLELNNLERLLQNIVPLINFSTNYEFTVEANPETINEKLLSLLKKYSVNRISIGIQSFNENILNLINRNYGIDIKTEINLVKSFFNNITIDLIYGFPNQTIDDLKNDLTKFLELEIPHISIYSLTVDKGTLFYNRGVKEMDDDLSRDFYDLIVSTFRKNGYKRYEVSNFAKPGYESKHNLNYWHDGQYVGLGVGAYGYEGDERYQNNGSLEKYNKGLRLKEIDKITEESRYEDYLITNLRLEDGFLRSEFRSIFGTDIYNHKKDIINNLISERLVLLTEDRFKCTDEGIALLNRVLLELI